MEVGRDRIIGRGDKNGEADGGEGWYGRGEKRLVWQFILNGAFSRS